MRKERFRDFYDQMKADLDSTGTESGCIEATVDYRLEYMLEVVEDSGRVFNGEQIKKLVHLAIYGGDV
ncbi:MAG: hypothetical protein MR754_02565 [Oribacterium sp.]|nr:hypothetical protein [Oribacterium sp.]